MTSLIKNSFLHKIYSKLTIAIIIGFCAIKSFSFWNESENWKMIVLMDGNGYYCYLPATFIYQDYTFKFYTDRVKPEPVWFLVDSEGKTVNKYFIGEAIALAPFFLASHGISYLTETEHSGYTKVYFFGVLFAGIFYMGMGLVLLRKILLNYTINDLWVSFILVCFGVGSNLFYYTTQEPSMSHVYSFSFITLFLFMVQKFSYSKKRKHYFISLIILSVVILIRPVNGVVLFFAPFFFKDIQDFRNELINTARRIFKELPYYLIAFSPLVLQAIIWKIETGRLLVESYPGESFNFGNPQVVNSLFSYNKGLFIYTPVCFLSCFGLITFIKQRNYFHLSVSVLFFSIMIYLLSSWYAWQYGWSFGLRAYIDFYSIFAIMFGLLVFSIRGLLLKTIIIIAGLFTTFLNLFQTNQYIYKIIHPMNMDKEKYWKVFLRNDESLQWAFFEQPKFTPTHSEVFSNNFEDGLNWPGENFKVNTKAHSGSFSCLVNKEYMYTAAFVDDLKRINPSTDFEVLAEGFCFLEKDSDGQIAIMMANEQGETVSYQRKFLREFGLEKWVPYSFSVQLKHTGKETLKVFVTGTEGECYADDFKITIRY